MSIADKNYMFFTDTGGMNLYKSTLKKNKLFEEPLFLLIQTN